MKATAARLRRKGLAAAAVIALIVGYQSLQQHRPDLAADSRRADLLTGFTTAGGSPPGRHELRLVLRDGQASYRTRLSAALTLLEDSAALMPGEQRSLEDECRRLLEKLLPSRR